MTRRSYFGAAEGRKSLIIGQISGPEPVWAAEEGYSYVQADSETDALLEMRDGLKQQLDEFKQQLDKLDDYIVERLEAKLAAIKGRS